MADTRTTRSAAVDFGELYQRLDRAADALTSEAQLQQEERDRVLAERARLLGVEREPPREASVPLLVFGVGGERYAVPLEASVQVVESRGLSPLPGAPRHVLGAMAFRGRIATVVDLRPLLGLQSVGMSDLPRVLFVHDAEETFGIAVEWVDGREDVPQSALLPAEGHFRAVTAERLAVLDLDRLGRAQDPEA